MVNRNPGSGTRVIIDRLLGGLRPDGYTNQPRTHHAVAAAVAQGRADWGITLKTVEIQDISPSETMQKAMEEQAAAERARRATVTRAEGEKSAAILQAEGRLEASKLDARSKVVMAEGDQLAITKITDAVQNNELPVMFILGGRYIEALKNVSTSGNSKIVMLPADLPAAIKGMLGK